jgi:hypothetical protein
MDTKFTNLVSILCGYLTDYEDEYDEDEDEEMFRTGGYGGNSRRNMGSG